MEPEGSSSPTLCALRFGRRLGEPDLVHRALTPSVATPAPHCAFHSARCGRAVSKIESCTPAGQEPLRLAPVKARGDRAPGRLRPLLLDLAAEWASSISCSPMARGPSTLFAAAVETRRVRDLGRDCALVPPARALRKAPGPWPEMLFHGLCNRPVVTSTQRPPSSRARRSRVPDRRLAQASCAARARTRRWAHAPRRRRRTVAGTSDPGWWCDVRRLHQLQPPSPPFRVDPSGPRCR